MAAIKNTHHGIATATHNMYAGRFACGASTQEISDDDGEYGGTRAILSELRRYNVINRVVVVTRWARGTQLGTRRWSIIKDATRNVLEGVGVIKPRDQFNISPMSTLTSAPDASSIDQTDIKTV